MIGRPGGTRAWSSECRRCHGTFNALVARQGGSDCSCSSRSTQIGTRHFPGRSQSAPQSPNGRPCYIVQSNDELKFGLVQCALEKHRKLQSGSKPRARTWELVVTEQSAPRPKEGPASYFPSIEKKYGRSIAEWQSIIGDCGFEKHMQIVGFLKDEHGVGHGHANALVIWTLRGNVAAT